MFGLAVHLIEHVEQAPLNITGSKHFSESCHVLGQLSKSNKFLQDSPRKIETLISGGGPNKSRGVGRFFEKIGWGGTLARDLRVWKTTAYLYLPDLNM